MTIFHSYAQNAEDVLLKRCFGTLETGFYIDVGASEPTRHSVTYALYLAGWHGIALEPLAERWHELEQLRPRDINLNLAVTDKSGESLLYRSLGRGGTSTVMPELGQILQQQDSLMQPETVKVMTLAEICQRHAPGRTRYELLKIDAEGAEGLVLAGADLRACRPLIIVAEGPAGAPAWETVLLEQEYRFAAFDGVNRWYVTAERPDLAKLLRIPVNVQDKYRRVDQLGSPLANSSHPDWQWALKFAQTIIGAVRTLGPDAILGAYLERMPPHMLDRPAGDTDFTLASRAVLGRGPTQAESRDHAECQPVPTVREVYDRLVRSDEFLARRGRSIASF